MRKKIFGLLVCVVVSATICLPTREVYGDPATSVYDGDFIPGSADDTIYAVVNAGTSPSDIDADLYQMVTMKGFTTGAIEYALNNGYMLGYIDLLKQGGGFHRTLCLREVRAALEVKLLPETVLLENHLLQGMVLRHQRKRSQQKMRL